MLPAYAPIVNDDLPPALAGVLGELGLEFRDQGLLRQALVHRSRTNETGEDSNERLEFLGDALIGLVVAEHLYATFPTATEGDLTAMRAAVVSRGTLGAVGRSYGIAQGIVLGRGEEEKRERLSDAVVGSVLEAVVGALLVDQGLEPARGLVMHLLEDRLAALSPDSLLVDAKSRLQHLIQGREKVTPRYEVTLLAGTEPIEHHARVLAGDQLLGEGTGRRRRDAEQAAAADALSRLGG